MVMSTLNNDNMPIPPTSSLPFLNRVASFGGRMAVIDDEGTWTYEALWEQACGLACRLLGGTQDLNEAPIAFIAPPGRAYVAAQWGIWLAGGIAVPLCLKHPPPELQYVLEDTGAQKVIVHPQFESLLAPLCQQLNLQMLATDARGEGCPLPVVDESRGAQILYTSGTTSRPKGVVTTHANLTAQIMTLIEAWGWREDDHILHVLPLHHTHGIVNVLLCALWAGATCEMLPAFDAETVWDRFKNRPLTLFMAVPTIYQRLIRSWEEANEEEQAERSVACQKLRLMVSGSAALPVSVLKRWQGISSHTLLERYGMTEIGMALSNPLEGERRAGTVGQPLPGVGLRLVDDSGEEITASDTPGEIQIQGLSVFKEYWQRPKATAAAFTDGWFLTGDRAVREEGYYRILGRMSVDIIKTGGYKVSALEIEEILRTHPAIQECAVVGVEDLDWGERVCAGVVLRPGKTLDQDALRTWAKERLAPYKVPASVLFLDDLPRNVMGKVTKPPLKQQFQSALAG